MVCAECGGKFRRNGRKIASGELIPTWVCITHLKDRDKCRMKPLKEEDIYAAYARAVAKLLGDKADIIEIVKQATTESLRTDKTEDIDTIRDELLQARKEVLELFKAKKDGTIKLQDY